MGDPATPPSPSQPTDPADGGHAVDPRLADLMARTAGGERAAWEELLTPYQDRLMGVCVRMVGREAAPDLVQTAMVKIIQGLASYDGQSKLSTWMIRVTMNACLSWLRSEKLRRHARLDSPAPGRTASENATETHGSVLTSREPQAADRVELQEARQHLGAALALLEPEQRAILILRDAQGMDYDRIALVLGVPLGTVKSRLFRARAALRALIESRTERASDRDL